MLVDSFLLLVPLIVLVGGGWLFGGRKRLSQDTLVWLITDFFMPMLVFEALYRSEVALGAILQLGAAVVFLTLVLGTATRAATFLTRSSWSALVMPVVFMNSGFLGIPLMELWGGTEAMSLIIVFDQLFGIIMFTAGLIVVTGGFTRRGFRAMIGSPILWAVLGGFGLRFAGIPVPDPILTTFAFAGTAAPPLAAFTLGCSLAGSRIRIDTTVIVGCVLRFGVGIAAGFAAVAVLGITGTTRVVVIVASALPAAVFSYVLPARYGMTDSAPRDIVVVTTVLSVITIPVSFFLAAL